LRFTFVVAAYLESTPHSSGFARLASGAFYFAISNLNFCEIIKFDMKIVLGSDHAGFELKADLRDYLVEQNIAIFDMGVAEEIPADYPEIARAVAEKISQKEFERGILICGSGIGMSIVANRFPGVRAALCHDLYTARMSREHNDANLLVLGGRLIGKGLAREMIKVWLESVFQGGRHQRRLDQIESLDNEMKERREK
jgi:ribose 5-phosphate isomerase B